MSMILKCQEMALLMNIVIVITGKELLQTSCVDSLALVGWFFLVSDPSRVFLFFYFDTFCIWHRI